VGLFFVKEIKSMCNQTGLPDILAGLSRQVKSVALGMLSAAEATEFNRSALWGGGDILGSVAFALDDIASLPLPTLSELGEEADLMRVTQLRIENRNATALLHRIKQLRPFQISSLPGKLQDALSAVATLEEGLIHLDVDGLDEACRDALRMIRQQTRGISVHLESCIAELRHQNDCVSKVLNTLEVES
jgi:hypothetical protein